MILVRTNHPCLSVGCHSGCEAAMARGQDFCKFTIVIEKGESDTNRKVQYPIYFISEVLSDSKTRYLHIMKLAYALLTTTRKLCHYF
jgi:hypothetical protein